MSETACQKEGKEVPVCINDVVDDFVSARTLSFCKYNSTSCTMGPPVCTIDDVTIYSCVIALVTTDTWIGRVFDGTAFNKHVRNSIQLYTLSSIERPGISNACRDTRWPVALGSSIIWVCAASCLIILLAVPCFVSTCDSISIFTRHFSSDGHCWTFNYQILKSDFTAVLDLDSWPSVCLDEWLVIRICSNDFDTSITIDTQILRVSERSRRAHVLIQVLVTIGTGCKSKFCISIAWVNNCVNCFLERIAFSIAWPTCCAACFGRSTDVNSSVRCGSGNASESTEEGRLDKWAHFSF